jgi:hypothetical protein
LIVAKGLLLLAVAIAAAGLVLLESPTLRTALLLGVAIWAACRFYYFLFHVLERYVDPGLRHAGLLALVRAVRSRRA